MNKKKPSKKTAKASKKAKVSDLEQSHGKEEHFQPTTLDQIWGDDGTSKYSTTDEEEYKEELDEMNKTDLESHATSLGILPAGDRVRLEERLVYEFQRHFNKYRMPNDANSTTNADVPDHVRKILEEGK
jgi:hypothetical protein